MDGWNTSFLLGWPIFRGYVSFTEGNMLIGIQIPAEKMFGDLGIESLPRTHTANVWAFNLFGDFQGIWSNYNDLTRPHPKM